MAPMDKREARAMTGTSKAPIWMVPMRQKHIRKTSINGRQKSVGGFVLIEMLMVVGLIGLMAVVAMVSFSAMWGNLRFKRQAEELVRVFQMAYNAAAEND